jgi:RNA ligase
MTRIQFEGWPKTPRLNRDITITEKIDGTNGAIIIEGPFPLGTHVDGVEGGVLAFGPVTDESGLPLYEFVVGAQSRNRVVTPGKTTDNYGFARWVWENADDLVAILGAGRHFGEWWGQGIARNYGLTEKRFSLFNSHRYGQLIHLAREEGWEVPELGVVPVLYQGPFNQRMIDAALDRLEMYGSVAEESFTGLPEGVIVYHSASKQVYKVLIENDELPKGLAA